MIIRRITEFNHQFQFYLANNVEFTEKEKEELFFRRISYLAFLFFIIVIGVPVWWVTTTPYRATLPSLETDYIVDLEKRLLQFSQNKNETNEDNNVWNNLQLNSLYNVHLVFIHPLTKTTETFINLSKIVKNKIASFNNKILTKNAGVEINLSSENLWDFSLKQLLKLNKNNNNQLIINLSTPNGQQLSSSLATALDRFILQPLGTEPLLKIAIFFEGEGNNKEPIIKIVDENEKYSTSIAIASWGGICVHNFEANESILLNSIMGILFKQLSIPLTTNENLINSMEKHRKRLTLYNLLQTLNSLNALHELASKIEDLVISDEVANYAFNAKFYFLKSYRLLIENNQIDVNSASKARHFAELANTHHSLLELLNFPSDQKYGIYVPLFLPLLVPLIQPLFLFVTFTLTKLKDYLKSRRMEKNKKLE
ncbi:hypothetical protein Mgra_00003971 [Meloidogyne graminicola]|uniref:GPI transamidase component PIG-S n=1 Tax=Meloidogyne graminicola TaxID=189291 RepID=A0A8S9ZTQ6_9BILA|nr:hypothetical protein Mgra_00003971 [Meloidogyne graminicola]